VNGPVQVAARLLAERTGMQLSGGLRERLAACLDGAARGSDQAPERYVAGLADDLDAFQRLVDCVTVQETTFFRHPDQFAALEREVLPAVEGPVSVWSVGCANGQEAYSLAMVLAASGHAEWQVVATDVSSGAVARATAGRYSTAELAGLPPVHRRWLRPAGELWEVDPALRRRVRVEQASLTARFPVEPGRCQVVFCRNVLIYLARSDARSFLDRLAGWLAPGGLVFLGYSEAIMAPTERLRVEQLGDTYALRAVPGAPVGAPAGTTRLAEPSAGARGDAAAVSDSAPEPGETSAMAAAGEAAAARGDTGAAVAAFRKAIFLDPDQPTAWFQLGLALEALPDRRGARRAYAAALAALERCDPGAVQAGLDGWRAEDLAGVLRAKLDPGPSVGPAPPLRTPPASGSRP
jgi:chemotaxis protein methyltransferase CheR